MPVKRLLMLIGLLHLMQISSAIASPLGVSFTYPIISQDPPNLHGYRGTLTYQPDSLIWKHWQIYFDSGFGHWWVNNSSIGNDSLSIYSISPIFRFYFTKNNYISPFLDLSIGFAYLTKTRIADRRLGIHFSFQDQVGLGISLGVEQRFFVSASILHYSNGSLSKTNAGITVPLLLNMGYRF